MRVWGIVLSTVLMTALAVLLLTRLASRPEGRGLGPVIPEPALLDTTVVWLGAQGDLEVLVRSFYADEERDSFNREQWANHLGLDPFAHAIWRVWYVQHGAESRPLDPVAVAGLRSPGLDGWRARDVRSLVDERRTPAYFASQVRVWSFPAGTRLEPGRLYQVAVAAPIAPPLADLVGLAIAGDPGVELRRARIRVADLLEFEQRPQGRLSRLVLGPPGPRAANDVETPRERVK